MAVISEATTQKLRSLYETSLEPYLKAEDTVVVSARRNRWLVLIGGLMVAAGIMALDVRGSGSSEFVPMVAFGIGVCAVGAFFLLTASLSDDVRHRMMADIAKVLGLHYDAHTSGFDMDRFEILGLSGCSRVSGGDRLSGENGGLSMEMIAVKLLDETTSGIGSDKHTRTTERFTGVLMRIADPAPPGVRFRLIPPPGLSANGMLRGTSTTVHSEAQPGSSLPPRTEILALLAAAPQQAPATPTGDPAFDARFELHAPEHDVAAALARLDTGMRAALLDIAGLFGGGAVSVGFDADEILLAFVTKQRFEIGVLRPPMAQFERVQHLADQMGVLSMITERIRTARQASV
jgi:hypothetical protein